MRISFLSQELSTIIPINAAKMAIRFMADLFGEILLTSLFQDEDRINSEF
jgi:hypothetical protein